jgi:hypothetical protein
VSTLLDERWASRQQVGDARPLAWVLVRTGRFQRGYTPWTTKKGDGARVNARIYGEKESRPWTGTWTPESAWVLLPNIQTVELTQDFNNNGITIATISLDNVVLTERTGPFEDIYHLIERGYLSPFRGSDGPARVSTPPANEWYGKLARKSQIEVFEGYGEDAMTCTFSGLIDDCDLSSSPDLIRITARDFGQTLTDQSVFGWVISPQLPEPTVIRSLGVGADGSEGTGVGYNASASTTRSGHPARFVIDTDAQTRWLSHDHTTPDNTEWVQVRLPRGRYDSFALHAGYAGMEMFVGVWARSDGLGGEPCLIDGEPIADGWIHPSDLPDPSRGGDVPGDNGGWPYIRRFNTVSDTAHTNTFRATLELGDDSVLRVGFRNLANPTPGVFRAGVERLAGIKRTSPTAVRLRAVGSSATASSTREGSDATNVTDSKRETVWLSDDHTTPGNTEWVEVRLPRGHYDSIRLDPAYAGMDLYVGVYARQGTRKRPALVDGGEVSDGWVDLGLGDVPGGHGGWPYVHDVAGLDRPDSVATIPLGHTFELGEDSVLRVAFRNLAAAGGAYRAGVSRLKALTRTGVEQPDAPTKIVQVGDLSDLVKVCLRWAGFKEWDIEPVGAPLKGTVNLNRASTLMDVIRKVQEVTGYVFYIAPPSDADGSIGVPTFRSNQSIADAPAGMPELHDTDMISAIQAKVTDEPLGYIIRVRGKTTSKKWGLTLGAQQETAVMAVYRPPWTRANKLSRIIRHVVHTERKLTHTNQCMVMAQLIALQEALVASASQVDIPGLWNAFALNQQVGLVDTGTGLNTRLFIASKSSTFTAGEKASWTTTLGGALIDTDDIRGVVADLRVTLAGMGINPHKINLGDPFGKN